MLEALIVVRNIIGNIAMFVIAMVVLYLIYQTIRGMFLAYDKVKWDLMGLDHKQRATISKATLFKLWGKYSIDMIGYDPGHTKWRRGNKTWTGWGTGR